MSKEIEQQVWDHAPVEQGTLLVLLALADNADAESRTSWPGIKSLARRSRLGERQVKNCIAALLAKGIITVQRNASPVKTNLYKIAQVSKWTEAGEVRGAKIAPPPEGQPTSPQDGSRGAIISTRGETHFPAEGKPTSPKPSVEPSDLEPSDPREGDLFNGADPQPPAKPETQDDLAAAFEEAWGLFPEKPNRGSKKNAKAKFLGALKRKAVTLPDLMRAIQLYRDQRDEECRAGKSEPQYTKAMEHWLNGEHWAGVLDGAPKEGELSPERQRLRDIVEGRGIRKWDMGAGL